MRVLTIFDLFAVLLLFAFATAAACSGEPLAIFALPPAVGMIAGRLRFGLVAGVAIDVAFIGAGLIAADRWLGRLFLFSDSLINLRFSCLQRGVKRFAFPAECLRFVIAGYDAEKLRGQGERLMVDVPGNIELALNAGVLD
jgi:hypothetical protein